MCLIRYGWTLMWQEAEEEMREHKILPPGSYDPDNCHQGKMWGWPKECNMTDNKAKRILFVCYKSKKLTWPMVKAVRQSLSYAFELCGGDKKKNWPSIKNLWRTFHESNCPKTVHSTYPRKIPTPKELKEAFTKGWTPETPMCLMRWVVGEVAAFDWAVFGLRSKEDFNRVKFSPSHVINVNEGWTASKFRNGRCKLLGTDKGTRTWWIYRVCLCPGRKHVSPPEEFGEHIGEDGNPTVEVRWNTSCPLACLQFYNGMLEPDDQRCYPKWLASGRFGSSNIAEPVELALEWFEAQGFRRYSSNAGRKSLGRWCRKLNISYQESFEIHGDLWKVWAESYEDELPGSDMTRRTQSRDPDVCTKALGRFANWLGRGKRVKPRLNRHERYQGRSSHYLKPRHLHHDMVNRGNAKLAHKIAHGLPSDDSSSEED